MAALQQSGVIELPAHTARPRVPSLDGLRAISIVLVIFSHAVGTQGFPITVTHVATAELGVRVFFIISGYLISLLLFAEQERHGQISLLKFYYRRGFRIFPAFYTMIAIIALLAALDVLVLGRNDVLFAVTYTTNYHYPRSWNLGHLWSLAVEEQFYLLWPATLLLVGRRRGLWAAAIFVGLSPLIRIATLRGYLPQPELIGETFQTIGDSIAVGCLLAGLRHRLDASIWYKRFTSSPAFLLVPGIVVASLWAFRMPTIDYAVAQPASNIAIALIIHWAVMNHDGVVGRILNFRPVVFVGTLSYSLYLWQQLFINRHSTALYCRFPFNIGCAFAVGAASFYFIEQPMLRLRERFEPRLFAQPKQGT